MTRHPWYLEPRAAAAVLAGAATIAGWSLRRAIVLDPLPVAEAALPDGPTLVTTAGATGEGPDVQEAVSQDPFRPQRTRPKVPFRLPGEALRAAAPGSDAPFRLIGTAVLSGGKAFAMCQVGQEPPRLVRLGERMGELVLRRVEQGKATFLSKDGATVEIAVPKAGT